MGAGLGLVGPQLLFVAEQRRALAAHDHRVHPGIVVPRHRPGQVIGPGHGDGGLAVEALAAGEVGGQAGVVQPRPVIPVKPPRSIRLGSEHHRRVAVGDQVVLEEPGQGPDRAGRVGHTRRRTQAATGREPGVGRLDPGLPAVGRELHPRQPHPRGERTGGRIPGVTRLHVDVVIGPGGQDLGVGRVDRHRRLVLLVLGEDGVVAADRHLGLAAGGRLGDRQPGEQGQTDRQDQSCNTRRAHGALLSWTGQSPTPATTLGPFRDDSPQAAQRHRRF